MADSVTLVTGASGFLGKAVMKLLTENSQRAVGLDPRPSATTQIVDDLSDRPRLKKLLADEKVLTANPLARSSREMAVRNDLSSSTI